MPTRKPATEGRAQGGHLHYTAARARLSEAATARRPSPLLENFSPFARTAELGLVEHRVFELFHFRLTVFFDRLFARAEADLPFLHRSIFGRLELFAVHLHADARTDGAEFDHQVLVLGRVRRERLLDEDDVALG